MHIRGNIVQTIKGPCGRAKPINSCRAIAALVPLTTKEVTYEKFTPRAAIRYEIEPQTSIYASYSEGFRSGTFPTVVAPVSLLLPIKPEFVDAYEIGLKTVQDILRFDIAGFYYKDKNLHVSLTSQICTPSNPPICTINSIFSNVPKAEIYGLDARLTITPIEKLNIRLGGAYLHARYRNFTNAKGTGLDLKTVLTPASNVNVTGQVQDWSD